MWQFTGQEAYERRAYFWNLLAAIMWQVRTPESFPFSDVARPILLQRVRELLTISQSLVTGRPPIILSTFIDCRIPTSEEEELYQEGEVPVGCECRTFPYSRSHI